MIQGKVYCRIIQENDTELGNLRVDASDTISFASREYKLNHIFPPNCPENEIAQVLAQDILNKMQEGSDVCVFEYGNQFPDELNLNLDLMKTILAKLFENASIGLKIWTVSEDQVINDLLSNEANLPSEEAVKECIIQTLAEAVETLQVAMNRSAQALTFIKMVLYDINMKENNSLCFVPSQGKSGIKVLESIALQDLEIELSSSFSYQMLQPLITGSSENYYLLNLRQNSPLLEKLECFSRLLRSPCVPEQDDTCDSVAQWLQEYSDMRKQLVGGTIDDATPFHLKGTSGIEQTLRDKNLPTSCPIQPDVRDLDQDTAVSIKITEASLLRKNYDTLLEIVREQDRQYKQLQRNIDDMGSTSQEQLTASDVRVNTLELHNVKLKSRLRQLEKDSVHSDYFTQYEDDIQSLESEVQRLRDENVALMQEGIVDNSEMKKRIKTLATDFEDLRSELRIQRSRNRQFLLNEKLVNSSSKKLNSLNQQVHDMDDELLNTRLGKAKFLGQIHELQQQNTQLTEQHDELVRQHARTVEELVGLKMYLSTLQKEKRKTETISSFLRKGCSKASASKLLDQLPQETGTSESCGILQTLHEAVELAEKESPELVPVLEKLGREVKFQTCQLAEFATREKDFIQVLGDLTDETPSSSLRDQIRTEMTTLFS